MTGFNAGIGYDLVTGLGSVDAAVLVNHWSDVAGYNFTLSSSPAVISITTGTSRSVTLTETAQNGFNSSVALASSGSPNGLTLTFSPPTIASSGSSTATIAAASNAVPGTYTVTVTGTAGGLTRTTPIVVTVVASPSFNLQSNASALPLPTGSAVALTLTTTALNGFKSAVALSVNGLPKGVTAAFSPASIASPGTGSSILKFAAATSVVAGTYNLTVNATGGSVTKTLPVTLTVTVPNFTLTPSVTSATIRPTAPAKITLTTSVSNGFRSAITLSASGQPKGVTITFLPATIASPGNGPSTLTIASATTATTGTYKVTITAIGGGLTRTQKITLTLTH